MFTVAFSMEEPVPLIIILNSLPSVILFSAYFIVLLSWAELYHSTYPFSYLVIFDTLIHVTDRLQKLNLRSVFLAVNFVLYTVNICLYLIS